MTRIKNLWFFADCDTCMAYCKDEKVKEFTDSNACEKFFSCLYREKCNKENQNSLAKERREKIDKILSEYPYDNFRKAVIDEIGLYLNILNIREVVDSYNYSLCQYILDMPCNFHYAVSFEMIDDYHSIYDYTKQQVAERLVENIRQSFLNKTLNKNK